MATFVPYAEVVDPSQPWTQVPAEHRTAQDGVLLQDLLQRSGGVYQMKVGLSRGFRETAKRLGELTANETLLHLASVLEVPVSLENLRYVDPETTRVAVGYRITYTDEESRMLNRSR